ncbi:MULTISPECIES: alanine racemase [unclassified Sphingopyxis]|jgi:alanine racemase|uniref:alanine racemase n=1 Tax=unclassified Sphingopyxis TaxID=2614943 RepID=UPI0006BF254D|nr:MULTISPECIES: alanine racemase [unclassified Sphingopyxis]USI78945.1 alanine racemase [Sphingopyxis sp. USTB-05]GAO78600.1 alanine racemase [Sphingopyxis sp. C-1]
MIEVPSPLRLRLDSDALVANWRWLAAQSGSAACGAAIKADGYSLGAREVMRHLVAAGCRDFFVATWREAAALMPLPEGVSLSVLHGVGVSDMIAARTLPARPVLNSVEQVQRWRAAGEGRPCDVMVDTGMNRLGLRVDEAMGGALDGLSIETLLSHLASADEDSEQNANQLTAFRTIRQSIPARRYSLANSAGICLGTNYAFDLTRPGIALYGGTPRGEARGYIRQVVYPETRVLQVRNLHQGETVGYNATWTAKRESRIAVANMGYADGYLRCHAGAGHAMWQAHDLPLIGRVSMDLIAFDASDAEPVAEGDWLALEYDLPEVSVASGLSQYELLTGLGARFERRWA